MGSCSGCIANLEDLSKLDESELKVNVEDGTYQQFGISWNFAHLYLFGALQQGPTRTLDLDSTICKASCIFKDISFQDKTTVTDKTIISSQSDSLTCRTSFSLPEATSQLPCCWTLVEANLPPSSTQITSGNVMIIGPATDVNIKMEGTSLTDMR
ncbi:hypothetical protein QOT17_020008 [Balamuthia mandrillaris]